MERAGAALVDSAVQALVCLFVGILTGVVVAGLGLGQLLTLDPVVFPAVLLASLLLYSLTEVFGAATPGKMLPQLRIARPDGRPAPTRLRLRRWAIRNAPLLLLTGYYSLWALELLTITGTGPAWHLVRTARALCGGAAFFAATAFAFGTLTALGPGGRTLHDYLSGTAVYHAADVAAMAAEADRGFEPVILDTDIAVAQPSSRQRLP
jgi:uncharacterized RDD family membrane protein YckC